MAEFEYSEVRHYQVNGRYRVQYERSAVKGQDGFKVEANSDDLNEASQDAQALYMRAQVITAPTAKIPEEVK